MRRNRGRALRSTFRYAAVASMTAASVMSVAAATTTTSTTTATTSTVTTSSVTAITSTSTTTTTQPEQVGMMDEVGELLRSLSLCHADALLRSAKRQQHEARCVGRPRCVERYDRLREHDQRKLERCETFARLQARRIGVACEVRDDFRNAWRATTCGVVDSDGEGTATCGC